MPENPMQYLFLALGVLLIVAYAIRFGKRIFAPVTVVEATVVHKQTVEVFSKYSGSGKKTKYAVTFSAGNKKLSFYVSEYSYSGYRIGETATLTYKADRLMDFS